MNNLLEHRSEPIGARKMENGLGETAISQPAMPINPDHLLSYPIPVARQSYGPRDCALYALTLGLGQDPMDSSALAYAGGLDDITPFPTLPLVLGHPGFWMMRPDTGIDAPRVVHGEQSIEILHPLAPSGTVVGRTRVTGLVDKGADHGALLYSERELSTESGTLLARMQETIVLRGDGGFGTSTRPPPPAPEPVPRTPPDWQLTLQTRPEQALYYRWNGDDNPLHRDPAAARRAGFERPILHGLCIFGMAARAIVQVALDWDASRLHVLRGRFTRPVVPGDTLLARIWRQGYFQIVRQADGRAALDHGRFG